jgi:hypothetical protein
MLAPATRSSFTANWMPVTGATGYRLDVSTSHHFETYLPGWRDVDIGNATGRVVTELNQGTTYYYRVRAYAASGTSASSQIMSATTNSSNGLIIRPVFDSSITNNPGAAVIEAAINRAIAIFESLFRDSVTINILFRYSATGPDGESLDGISQSYSVVYPIPWQTYINALKADARTSNDTTANNSLGSEILSTNVVVASANGRAVNLNTPPAMFANATVAHGGPFDGIVTVNSAKPFQFSRPVRTGFFDAQRMIEHEIDEVLGLGSHINHGSDLRPQDLFSWYGPTSRNYQYITAERYFSINGGSTNIVRFNQNPTGDLGDWSSGTCPKGNIPPYVQDAIACPGDVADVSEASPEGINLDVIGYDSVVGLQSMSRDFNHDGKVDYVLYNSSTGDIVIWYLNNNVGIGGRYGRSVYPVNILVDVPDFDDDGRSPDILLYRPDTGDTAALVVSGPSDPDAAGPTIPAGWQLVATGLFNNDDHPDYVLYSPSTRRTAIWYLTGFHLNDFQQNSFDLSGALYGPTVPDGWTLAGVADFNRDGHPDYLLVNSGTKQTAIWYLKNNVLFGALYGPTIADGWKLVGAADFDGDGYPDYVLFNVSDGRTAIWYLKNNAFAGALFGPDISPGWILAAP